MKKLLNGQLIDLTSEEITQKETDKQNAIVNLQQEEQQKQNAIDKKASGKQKLKDLGLDDDEIKALMGA